LGFTDRVLPFNEEEVGTNLMNITALTVSYNTKDVLQKTIESFREYYDIPLIVIDGSPEGSECYEYVKDLDCRKVQFGWNVGHGRGMDIGINLAETKYVVIFDSDIEIIKPPIEDMMKLFKEDTFGVGWLYDVQPFEVYGVNLSRWGDMPCMVPFFHIINRYNYMKFLPYIHSGAPCVLTMCDIFDKRCEDTMIDFPIKEYIKHPWRGTRDLFTTPEEQELWKDQVKPNDYFSQKTYLINTPVGIKLIKVEE
jgi:glycosyltransferase involved in cell wall biosynthesis